MIDYCIRQKKSRDDRVYNEKSLPGLVQPNVDDSDEEFFDAEGLVFFLFRFFDFFNLRMRLNYAAAISRRYLSL